MGGGDVEGHSNPERSLPQSWDSSTGWRTAGAAAGACQLLVKVDRHFDGVGSAIDVIFGA